MNIQISGLPDNQKIKSINFNIVFDSSDSIIATSTDISTINTDTVTINTQDKKHSIKSETKQSVTNKSEEVPKPDDIDISNRVAKIDPNMLEEVF